MTDTLTPAVVPTPVTWHTPSETSWVAYRGAVRVGSVARVGAYIATDRHGDVVGAFVDLAEAQRAIADPQPADADLVRRAHARQARWDAAVRRVALAGVVVAAVMVVVLALALVTSARS